VNPYSTSNSTYGGSPRHYHPEKVRLNAADLNPHVAPHEFSKKDMNEKQRRAMEIREKILASRMRNKSVEPLKKK